MFDFLPLLREKMIFECLIENLVLNLSLTFWKMKSGLQDILRFRLSGSGMEQIPFSTILLYHNTMLCLQHNIK